MRLGTCLDDHCKITARKIQTLDGSQEKEPRLDIRQFHQGIAECVGTQRGRGDARRQSRNIPASFADFDALDWMPAGFFLRFAPDFYPRPSCRFSFVKQDDSKHATCADQVYASSRSDHHSTYRFSDNFVNSNLNRELLCLIVTQKILPRFVFFLAQFVSGQPLCTFSSTFPSLNTNGSMIVSILPVSCSNLQFPMTCLSALRSAFS